MSDFKTTIKNYTKAICDTIKSVDGVYRCRRYKGQLTNESLDRIKLQLRNHEQVEVFVHFPTMQGSEDRIGGGLYLDALVQVYIVGSTSQAEDDLGYSDPINDVAADIYNKIFSLGNKIGDNYIIGNTVVGALISEDDAIENNTRVAMSSITFTQKIRV